MLRGVRSGLRSKSGWLLAALPGLLWLLALSGVPTSASAASGGNFIATGHDMDFHCGSGETNECAYFKIVVDRVRNGSTLPILALDQGTEVSSALVAAGYSASAVTTVDPSNAAVFNATAFVDGTGHPLWSAIITASDSTCGGCDNTPAGESNINARSSDFTTYFNAEGGILALSGADNFATYYNFVPLGVAGTAVGSTFTPTSAGTALGITSTMTNCCATHNSFRPPASPFMILETDDAGNAETIAAFNTTIGGGGFGDPTSLTVNGGSGTVGTPTKVSGVLMDTKTATAASGQSVVFKLNGAETCTGTTDATGAASCSLTPGEPAGTYTLAGSFAGGSGLLSSSGSANFVVNAAPAATAASASVKGKSATFTASVTPNGLPTTVHFEYGLDRRYRLPGDTNVFDQQTPDQPVGSDFTTHFQSASVSGLVPNALYHVHLVAINSAGKTIGPDMTFQTAKDPEPGRPTIGKNANLMVVSGVVLYKLEGHSAADGITKGAGFIPLTEDRQLPVGTQVDARAGVLNIVSASAASAHIGKIQTATLGGALFKFSQLKSGIDKGLTSFSLLEGDFPGAPSFVGCTAKKASDGPLAQAAVSRRILQTLRARDKHGQFRTIGRFSAGTVRGTQWTTTDRCDGTLTTVQRGTVSVFDNTLRTTVLVHAHHSYLALAKKKKK
jgi:hypothetical protein